MGTTNIARCDVSTFDPPSFLLASSFALHHFLMPIRFRSNTSFACSLAWCHVLA